jgi:4,5:9,10-diseco-3-hydroxy-5,9,17-trioxoandrosta-1(10),2-diene-4-oate hydrolase
MWPSDPARFAVGAAAPFSSRTVDGVRLAFDDAGQGPAVVCLHALGHGAADFARLRERLRSRYRVIAVDWPGQGRSDPDRLPTSGERYAALLGGLLDALDIERAVLVGNSIGGNAALRWAAAHPERARGLVLENPGGLDAADDLLARVVFAAMDRFFAAGCRRAAWFPRAFAAYYRTCVLRGAAAKAQRTRIVAAAYETAPVFREAWQSFAAPTADVRALAPRVTCPVLFAWATGDRFVQLRRSLPAIRCFPNARVEKVHALHAVHLERPELFEPLVERFLSELDGDSAERAPSAGVVRTLRQADAHHVTGARAADH